MDILELYQCGWDYDRIRKKDAVTIRMKNTRYSILIK